MPSHSGFNIGFLVSISSLWADSFSLKLLLEAKCTTKRTVFVGASNKHKRSGLIYPRSSHVISWAYDFISIGAPTLARTRIPKFRHLRLLAAATKPRPVIQKADRPARPPNPKRETAKYNIFIHINSKEARMSPVTFEGKTLCMGIWCHPSLVCLSFPVPHSPFPHMFTRRPPTDLLYFIVASIYSARLETARSLRSLPFSYVHVVRVPSNV